VAPPPSEGAGGRLKQQEKLILWTIYIHHYNPLQSVFLKLAIRFLAVALLFVCFSIKAGTQDEFAHLQNDYAVYHDDIGDYATNEPTMGGTSGAVLMIAYWGE
jgi:hypothetical protein